MTAASPSEPTDEQAYQIAKDGYVYAYPLVLTYLTLRQLTNFSEQAEGGTTAHGPANRFNHARAFPDLRSKVVIRPNVDTLYSSATLDLKAEPLVLSVPATDRYFMLPMLSLWTDAFAVPGTAPPEQTPSATSWSSAPGGMTAMSRSAWT